LSSPPTPESAYAAIDASLAEAGLSLRRPLPASELGALRSFLSPALRSRYGADAARSAFAVALPYGEGPAEPPPWARDWLAVRPGPLAAIARFARANWYAELVARLRAAASLARGRLEAGSKDAGPSRGWRFLANSGLPEKRLALAAGLGELGRHGLVMVPGAGSACVLGLLLAPIAAEGRPGGEGGGPRREGPPRLGEGCGSCRSCLEACPTGALSGAGYDRELCLQSWSTRPGPLPPAIEAAWGGRLYGCDACQEACPRFRPDPGSRAARGLLGPGLPASWLIEAPEAELSSLLRGSALGLGWMPKEAFRRNAALALRGI